MLYKNPLAAIFILCLCPVFALGQTKTMTVTFPPVARVLNPAFQGKPEQRFETLEHQLSDAERLGDGSTLNQLLSDRLMILGTSWTREQWMQLLISGKGTFVNVEKSDMRIQIFGDTVIVTGTKKVDSKTANGSRTYQFGFMDTWMRTESGKWQCVAMAADQVR